MSNDPVTANADTYITDEDTAININAASGVLSNDSDIDTSDVLSVSDLDTTTTTGSVILNADGSFSYDPNGQFANPLAVGETATDTFSYTVSDGNGSMDTATVTLTIHGVNAPVTANADTYHYSAMEDTRHQYQCR